MNMTQWHKEVIESKKLIAIPIMTHPGIELIGETVDAAVKDGVIHAQAIKALSDKYPSAAATVIMDLTVEAEAFGAPITFAPDEVPAVNGRLLNDLMAVEALKVPGLTAARVPEYLKANKLAKESISDKPVLAGCIGPYSLAGRLYDITEFMMSIYTEPDTAMLLLEKCTEFITKYIKAIKETGVDGIVIAEPAAGLLSDEDATMFSSVYVKQIVEAVQDDYFLVVLHNCGNTGQCTQSMIMTGAKGLHFGNKINMLDALKEVPANVLAMGNLDPVSVLKLETSAGVAQATRELLEATKAYNNFILSSGCDAPPGVPFENIEAFYNTLAEYNKA